jgi:RNA polymerase sigma-70 factor, ECF subfamily
MERQSEAMIRTVAPELIEDGSDRATPAPVDLEALFRAEGDGVYRTLFAFTGGRADVAEEATAEAFARAVAERGTLRDPLAWIYRVAFRVAIDDLRRDRRRGDLVDAPTSPPELSGLVEALRRLSPNQRAAIVLRHVLDLDVAEVARRMGVAAPTVRVHLHRGRARLRELLGSEEVD